MDRMLLWKTNVVFILMLIMHNVDAYAQASDQQKLLFAIAGQSNAVGQGDSTMSADCSGLPCFEYDVTSNTNKPLKDPVGQKWNLLERASYGSIAPAFAKRMYELVKKDIYIVTAARGGASCHRKAWLPPYNSWDERGGVFDDAKTKIDKAITCCGTKLSGIIWLQGERDANAILDHQLTKHEYKESLKNVIIRFRKRYGKDLAFYIVMTGFQKDRPHNGCMAVRTAQQEVCLEMNSVFIVYDTKEISQTEGWYKDFVHYNQQALNMIGKTLAEEIIEDEKIKPLSGDLTNRYGWHLKIGDNGQYELADKERISEILDISKKDSVLIPYHYIPKDIKDQDYKNCKTISAIYQEYDHYELPIEIDIPKGKGPFPFVIYIHGGGWGGGSLKVYEQHSQYLASKGIAGVRIAYSLVNQGGTFTQVENEIDQAIAYLYKNHRRLHLDISRWGIMGASAGAHLGSIAALEHKDCRMFIGLYGAYDLLCTRHDNFPNKDLCKLYLGNTDEKSLMNASAIYHIPVKNIPRVFLLHGTADLTINCEQTHRFADQLRKKGCHVSEQYEDGYGHSFTNKNVSDLYEPLLSILYHDAEECFGLHKQQKKNQDGKKLNDMKLESFP